MSDTTVAETPTTERLRKQATTVKDDMRELGRLTKEASQEKLHETTKVAGEYVEKGRKKVEEMEDSVVTYVKEKPVKSILMAVGAGALLGFLLSRR